ncbi:MAG TPA: terminase family protein [Terriglobales bacterium]|nr:terminase family protein [Terriglobales bacterium]
MTAPVWTPQPKQAVFMSRPEYEALYGGAAGGGKSDALVVEALRQVEVPHYKGLILRKTGPQLAELIDKSKCYYRAACPGARYSETARTWTFPSGAKVLFGSMQYPKDRVKYQGTAYDYIAFDEATHFTYDEYSYLFSRNRPNGPGTRVYMRASANPGGVGHAWVKARFISPAPPLTPIWEDLRYTDEAGQPQTRRQSRIFVPSTVFDNKALLQNDPLYAARLAALPSAEQRALLYGDWDTFSGQVFTEWRNDPARYGDRKFTHVVSPFKVPGSWRIWRAFDWGYRKPFSCHWYAADGDRRLYCVRELYGSAGEPDVGLRWEPARVAAKIKAIEAEDENLRGKQIFGVADPAIFGDSGAGESVARLMEKERIYFEPGANARLAGKMQVHHRLAFDGEGIPMLYVFSTCVHLIRTLPALVYDAADVEDVDTKGEDHAYDELRYICMKNPITPRPQAVKPVQGDDPLELAGPAKYDSYQFYKRM